VIDGKVDLVIGARSAIFAPFPNLGMIAIDEEHEARTSPERLRATTRARWPCTAPPRRAVLLMGSATPSLEAWHHMREGTITELRLPDRLSGGAMPSVEVIDMRHQQGRCRGRSWTRSARPTTKGGSRSFS